MTDESAPHNLEAEKAVLGACLINVAAVDVAAAVIDAADFWRDSHARIWRAILTVQSQGAAVDLVTVRDALATSGDLESIGGPAYVSALADGLPRSTNVEHYARIVRRASLHRRAQFLAGRGELEGLAGVVDALHALDPSGSLSGPYPPVEDDDWTPADGWPAREWLIPGWLPVGRLGMLSGRGGRGKSRLALQLAARLAAGQGGVFVPPATSADTAAVVEMLHPLNGDLGPVVYASWEDEREEVGRRLAAMAKDGLVNVEAVRGKLRFIDLRGVGPLWAPAAGGSGHVQTRAALTSAGGRVRATCEALKARLLVVDSLAGAYAGDENTRALVRAFCADWDAWASANRCTVMLIAHPPKAPSGGGAPSVDADYAGSTDWHNAARWRWALEPTPTGRTRADKTGKDAIVVALALKLAKSSYGPDGARLFLASSESQLGWRSVSVDTAAANAAAEGTFRLGGGETDGEDADGAGPIY